MSACVTTTLRTLHIYPCVCRYEKSVRDGRRRCHSWFLIDQLGVEHLAVVGLETDTLDGHYVYQAVRARMAGCLQQQ